MWDTATLKIPWPILLRKLYITYDTPVVGFFTFDEPALLIRDPQIVKQILVKDFHHFQDRVIYQPEHNKMFSNLLFVMKNPDWKSVRAKLTPVFTSAKIKDLFSVVKNVGEQMVSFLKSTESTQECKILCQRFSTEATTQSLFGFQGQCFQNEDSEMMKKTKELFGFSIRNGLIQSIYFFKGSLVKIFKLEFFQEGIETFFRDTFWESLKIVQERNVKPYNFISLLDELRKTDSEFGK